MFFTSYIYCKTRLFFLFHVHVGLIDGDTVPCAVKCLTRNMRSLLPDAWVDSLLIHFEGLHILVCFIKLGKKRNCIAFINFHSIPLAEIVKCLQCLLFVRPCGSEESGLVHQHEDEAQ